MAAPRPGSLPFDVVETIGSYLSDWKSKDTIRACVLTCRLWYNAIRPSVYRRMSLRCKEDVHKLRTVVASEPVIGQWIYELQISYSDHHLGVYDWFLDFPEVLHAESLGNLRSLEFHSQEAWHMSGSQGQAVTLLPRLAAFHTITHLSFFRCVVPYDLTKAIICSFPELQDLHMHSVICTQPSHRLELPMTHQPCKLQSVRIHADDRVPADGFYPELLLADMSSFARSILRSLTTLQFHFSANNTTVLQDLAKIVFPSEPIAVQNLEFYFPICKGYSAVALASCNRFIVDNLNMSMFTSLRTFHVRGLNQAEMTFAVIHALDSPKLSQVTVGVTAASLMSSQSDNYTLVDACLADAEKFPRLRAVHVFSYSTSTDTFSGLTEKVQMLFPNVSERGILKTSLAEDPDVDVFASIVLSRTIESSLTGL